MKKRLLLCLVCLLLLVQLPLAALAESMPERLTMEQLEQLREEGKAEYMLSDQGYVTWLRGEIYDGKVEGEEGVLAVVERTRDLLGLDEEAQFVKGVAWAQRPPRTSAPPFPSPSRQVPPLFWNP